MQSGIGTKKHIKEIKQIKFVEVETKEQKLSFEIDPRRSAGLKDR